jgi:DNA processing protein
MATAVSNSWWLIAGVPYSLRIPAHASADTRGGMISTLPSARDHVSDVQPEGFERLTVPGYPTEAIAFLGISRLHGVGFQTMVRLGGRDSIHAILKAGDVCVFERSIAGAGGRLPDNALPADWTALLRLIWQRGIETASQLVDAGIRFSFHGEPEFPRALADLPQAYRPLWLFYRGDIGLLDRPCVTVVGTREPTDAGEFLARYAVSCAREFGTPVVSGLAHGIDRIVHEWCLRIDLPTISVQGTGMLNTYPVRHTGLGNRIVEAGGLLLSEYLPDQGPSAQNFVWRNRLQAALGRIVIPAEWARKSGTAHTVRFARKFKRPVFSVSPSSASRAFDAGEGDTHFELPHDHIRFIEAMGAAINPNPDSPPALAQMDLFGNIS